MEPRVKEVASQVILYVNSAEPHFMGTMNCTRICQLNTIHAIYAKGEITSFENYITFSLIENR